MILIQGILGNWPLVPEEFQYRLDQIPENAPIELRISSTGGDPMAAVQMYNILRKHSGQITAYIEDYCYSATTLLAAVADEVVIDAKIGRVMIHDPEGLNEKWAREEEHRSVADLLADVKSQMRNIYVEWTGQPENTIRQWMSDTTYFDAEGAVEAGFADRAEIFDRMTEEDEDNVRFAAQYKDDRGRHFNAGRDKSPHKTIKNKSTEGGFMSSITARLKSMFGLGDDSDEADVVISAKEMKKERDTLKAEVKDLKEENEKLKQDLEDLKTEQSKAEEEAEEEQEEEFKTVLEAAVSSYKIKASDKEGWRDDFADKGPDALKAAFDRIPEGAVKPGKGVNSPKAKTKAQYGGRLNEQVAKDLGVTS